MHESKLLAPLLPSSPDFLPIINEIRRKYQLEEANPDDEPIKEIYLNGEPVALEDFRSEIEGLVEQNIIFLPPELNKIFLAAKMLLATPPNMVEVEGIPDVYGAAINDYYKLARTLGGSSQTS